MKIGNGNSQPPMDNEMPPMEGEPPMTNKMPPIGSEPPMTNEMPPMDNNDDKQSTFDTNFDAGVNADEDEDPKRYIQQLTGKLSTKLSSFLGEDDDEELCKYVGKMIIKQVSKGLDSKAKKELINTLKSEDNEDENITDDNEMNDEIPMDNEMNDIPQEDNGEEQLNECFTKKQLKTLTEGFTVSQNDDVEQRTIKEPQKKKTSFRGKKFN